MSENLKYDKEFPLDKLSPGERAAVCSLSDGRTVSNRLVSLGFTPGVELEMAQNFGHGPLIVTLRGTRVALGRGEAAKIHGQAEFGMSDCHRTQRQIITLSTPRSTKTPLIALAGQPNMGKSTLFNLLTGLNQHVGNWPGKTVERREGSFTLRRARLSTWSTCPAPTA